MINDNKPVPVLIRGLVSTATPSGLRGVTTTVNPSGLDKQTLLNSTGIGNNSAPRNYSTPKDNSKIPNEELASLGCNFTKIH